ncbi:MAG: hypothetical protein JXR95_10090 [Deltaproteobacteria bacterium]|nr:hypothetical protein [Deltaproteobacteria bacterium]
MTSKLMKITNTALLFFLFVSCGNSEKSRKSTPVRKVIPLTAANLKGHKMLYNEGWFIVTSTKRSIEYARKASITSSAEAIRKVALDIKENSKTWVKELADNAKLSYELAEVTVKTGRIVTKTIFSETNTLGKKLLTQSNKVMLDALDTFWIGNISIAKRTKEDREALMRLGGDTFSTLKEDYSNLYTLSRNIKKRVSKGIRTNWDDSFAQASQEFKREYDKSGKRKNSLLALGNILVGYLKAFYHGLARPGAKTIVKTTIKGLKYGVFLPTAAVAILAGRTVQSTSIALFYVGKLGIKLVSPTIESGFLATLGLISYGTVPVTYTSGAALGAFSQVAFSVAGPTLGATHAVAKGTYDAGKYVATTIADTVSGTAVVAINQLTAGATLGYNALTAIPAHLYLGTIDAAIFLAWDGPRLVIAMARGKVSFTGSDAKKKSISMGELPVGTVVDLKKLKKVKGVKVKVISKDPDVIKKVIHRVPDDFRQGGNEINK